MTLLRKLVGFINFGIGLPITFYLFPTFVFATLWYWHLARPDQTIYVALTLGGIAGVFGFFGGWRLLKDRKHFRLPLGVSGILWLLLVVTAFHNLPVVWNAGFALLGNLNLIIVGLDLRIRKE